MRKLIVIGDSWTYGSEIRDPNLPESVKDWDKENDGYRLPKIWPTKLTNLMGYDECINLSYPAASNDRSVRVLVQWLTQEYFLPKKPTDEIFVIIGLTSPERKDFFYEDLSTDERFWITLWPMWKHKYWHEPINELSETYVKYFWNPEEYTNRYVNQLLYLQSLLNSYGVKHMMFQAFYQRMDTGISRWTDQPYVRDYTSMNDKMVWDLIDPVRFVNKDSGIHSFHNYITNKDETEDKKIALLDMHPSETGHTWWAEYLFEYIKLNNLTEMGNNEGRLKFNNERRTKLI